MATRASDRTRTKVSVPSSTNLSMGLGAPPRLNLDIAALFSPMIAAAQKQEEQFRTQVYGGPGVTGSLGAIQNVLDQPTNLPALPVPQESRPAADFVGRLGANLASVMTGQGGFAASMEESIQRARQDRENVIRQNQMLQREEMINSRGEKLQFLYEQHGRAADALREAGKHSLALQQTALQAKVSKELQQFQTESDTYQTKLRGMFDVAQQYIAKGFTFDMSTGTVDASGLFGSQATQNLFWNSKEAEQSVLELDQLMLDKRFQKTAQAQRNGTIRKLELLAIPRQGEDFRSIVERLTGTGAPQFGYDNKVITPDAKEAILVSAALQYSGIVPGAKEYLEAKASVTPEEAGGETAAPKAKEQARPAAQSSGQKAQKALADAKARLQQIEEWDRDPTIDVAPETVAQAREAVIKAQKLVDRLNAPLTPPTKSKPAQ